MEVMSGYKQTEIGIIPMDWGCRRLEEVTDHARPIGYGIVQTGKTVYNGIKCVRVVDIIAGKVDPEELITTTPEISQAYKRTLLRENDLIIALRGKIGAVAVVEQALVGANLTRGVALLSASDSFHSDYLCQYLSSTVAKGTIERSLNGSALQEIPIAALRKIPVVVPPLPEQRTIAEALSDADALLNSLDRLIAKKRNLKQAAMQQLLTGQTRLPGFSGEWEVKQLGDIGECIRGVTYKGDSDLSAHDTAQTTRLLRSNNVQNATVVIEDIQFVNADRVSEHQLLRANDILICMANGSKALVGKAGLFNVNDGYDYTFGAFMGCFRSNTASSISSFVFYLFQTERYRNYISNLLAGSSINNLSPGSIESLEFQIPPTLEQTAIAAVLLNIDSEVASLENRLKKTRAIKHGMMQALLTGRTRLV